MLVIGTPKFQSFLSTGAFNAGGFVYTYVAGSSTTQIASYATITDALNKTNPNTNPVVLDSQGSANLVLNGATRLIIYDSNNNLLYSFDNLDQSSLDIVDANGNTLVHFASSANAENYVTITNEPAGTDPRISATGGDTNRNLDLHGTGSGGIKINGAYVLPIADGSSGQLMQTNGAGTLSFTTVSPSGRLNNVQVFTTSGAGTYIPTAGTTSILIIAVGGGAGGGAGGSGAGGGGGGGAGALVMHRITSSLLTSYPLNIGALGNGGATGSNNGIVGGDTTFGTGPIITAGGGTVGLGNASAAGIAGAAGGTATGGNLVNSPGGSGGPGLYIGSTTTAGGAGGNSFYGGAAAAVVTNTTGNNATGYGAGGGGGAPTSGTARAGGNGSAGIIIIYEYF